MAEYNLNARLVHCAKTAAEWATTENAAKVLKKGELGLEVAYTNDAISSCKIKVGDGVTKWSSLPYVVDTLFTSADKTKITNTASGLSSHVGNKSNPHGVTKAQVGLGNVDNTADANKNVKYATSAGSASSASSVPWSGVTGKPSLVTLDSSGKVPSSQLPSYVDDVVEYDAKANFPKTGETSKIYVDKATNKTYRWSGSAYVEISASLALGETSATAYRGDRGKIAYDHSQIVSGNPHKVTKTDVGLGNVENKSSATIRSEITKANVTNALGYTPPTTNTTYSQATSSALGLVKIGYTASGKNYPVVLNSSGQMYVNVPWTDNNTTYTAAQILGMIDDYTLVLNGNF